MSFRRQDVEQRFIQAYETFSDALFRHFYFRLSNKERALELVQETFTRSWKYIVQGKEILELRSFLYRVANNLIVDEYRRRETTEWISLDALTEKGFDVKTRHHEAMMNYSEGREMLKALALLDEKYRHVVVLRYIDGLSPKEIAEVIGETENNVSVRLNRALVKIRIIHHG